MIRQVFDETELYSALTASDVYSEKIRSFCRAYGFSYPFCRFFVQDGGAVIGSYYGGAAVCGIPSDFGELSAFLLSGGFSEILMPWEMSVKLGFGESAERNCLYKFSDTTKRSDDITKEELTSDASLGQIYEIISNGFDIEFETWYTDTSHNVRHGVSEVFCYKRDSAAVKMFSSENISYISYVATRQGARGFGLSTKLIRFIGISEKEKGNDTFVICRNKLRSFYESAGFVLVGYSATITIKEE